MNLKVRIYAASLTQEKVSALTGIDNARLSRIVRGLIEPSADEISRIENVLKTAAEGASGALPGLGRIREDLFTGKRALGYTDIATLQLGFAILDTLSRIENLLIASSTGVSDAVPGSVENEP